MYDLEGVTDSVVLSLEGPEARQNRVVDSLHQYYFLEWIVVLDHLVLLIPSCDSLFCRWVACPRPICSLCLEPSQVVMSICIFH